MGNSIKNTRAVSFEKAPPVGGTKPDAAHSRIFYGWYILAIGILGAVMAAGTSQLFMSIMLKPLTAEFGWNRTAATGAITTGTIMAGVLSYPFGKLADRYGPRMLATLGALITAGVYIAIGMFVSLWQFYVVFVIGRVVSMNTLSSTVPRTSAVNWFRRYRGRVLGLLTMATPLGSSLLAMIAHLIMESYGWRTVFMFFALAMVLFQALPAAIVLRRQPEDLGLLPDGARAQAEVTKASAQTTLEKEFSWTLTEAVRTSAMWLLVLGNIVAPAVGAGISFHMVAYFTDMGLNTTVAVGAISVFALTGAGANVIWGFLSERVQERFLASTVMAMTGAAIMYLLSVKTNTGAFVFAVLFGLAVRGEVSLFNMIQAQFFGRSSFGAISGFIAPFHMLGLGFGPMISSVSFDLTGSYRTVFSVYVVISMITAGLMLLAKKPKQPAR